MVGVAAAVQARGSAVKLIAGHPHFLHNAAKQVQPESKACHI